MGVPIKLTDGSVVLVEMKADEVLTDEERAALVEWIELVRDTARNIPVTKTLHPKTRKRNGRKDRR